MIARTIKQIGNDTNKNVVNPISSAFGKRSRAICAKIRFGGVPINVTIPPTEQQNGMAKNKHLANGSINTGSPVISSSLVIIANALGSIVNAVAVFETHIAKMVVTSINPNKRSHGRTPNSKTVFNDNLVCKFQRIIANEYMKPPKKTIVVSDHIDVAIILAVEIWNNGIKKTGKNDDITIGIGSNTQYNAVHNKIPMHGEANGRSGSRTIILKRNGIAITIGMMNSSQKTTFAFSTIFKNKVKIRSHLSNFFFLKITFNFLSAIFVLND